MTEKKFSPVKFVVLLAVLLPMFFCCLSPVFYWLYMQQRATDEGARIVAFNNTDAPVTLVFDGERSTLAPRETFRSDDLTAGDYRVEINGRSMTITTGWDATGYLVAAQPAALVVVDTGALFANLGTGRMMGADLRVVSAFAPADSVHVPRRWTLSPYEPLPQSTFGSPPHKAILVPTEALGDEVRLRAIVDRTPL